MKKTMLVLCEVFAVLLLAMPKTAAESVDRALLLWRTSVVPAMFPFLTVLPLLTCEEARRWYSFAAGWFMKPVFCISGELAPAAIIGMIAGSPAGAIAAVRAAGEGRRRCGEFKRCALAFGGMSPAFLISGVGGMFGSAETGVRLLLAQICTQLTVALVLRFRFCHNVEEIDCLVSAADQQPVRGAVMTLLQIGGYMSLFSVISGMIAVAADDAVGKMALCLLDCPSGIAVVARAPWPSQLRAMAAGALLGFGGLCVAFQNMGVLKRAGVRWREYLPVKILAAALCTGYSGLFCCEERISEASTRIFQPDVYDFSAVSAVLMAVPPLIILASLLSVNIHERGNRVAKIPQNTLYVGNIKDC